MTIFRNNFLILILFSTGCTSVKVQMQIDTALEDNALIYKLSYPDSLADKLSGNRLNVSFGPYRVTDADLSWTRTSSRAEDPDPVFHFKSNRQSGNTTTTTELKFGPLSLFGFSRPPSDDDPTIDSTYRVISYTFKAGQNRTWNALCVHRSEKRVPPNGSIRSTEVLSSNFICQYQTDNTSDHQTWVLSIDYGGTITMTRKGKPNTLTAHSTGGKYYKHNGQATNLTTRYAGYTWRLTKNGRAKNIAAISTKEEIPRVWLDKRNHANLNHVLSLANTGLLVYSWEITH